LAEALQRIVPPFTGWQVKADSKTFYNENQCLFATSDDFKRREMGVVQVKNRINEDDSGKMHFNITELTYTVTGHKYYRYASFKDEEDGGNSIGWVETSHNDGRKIVAKIGDDGYFDCKIYHDPHQKTNDELYIHVRKTLYKLLETLPVYHIDGTVIENTNVKLKGGTIRCKASANYLLNDIPLGTCVFDGKLGGAPNTSSSFALVVGVKELEDDKKPTYRLIRLASEI